MNAARSEELLFVALGGAGEIGMNLNLYGYGRPGAEQWMMVDLGITFGDDSIPGVDVIMPDPAFIEERRDRLAGLVLTHAHEDHLGAVPYLWRRLQCPVYATPFTASILRRKLREVGLDGEVPLHEVPLGGRLQVGPFDVEMITLTHSIPEPNAVAIRTPLGMILHTGDWKLDPGPVVGPLAEEDALRQLGEDGVLGLVCDSTNVFNPGASGSEADLLPSLTEVIGQCKTGVAVTCFASNVARLETISAAAAANGRDCVLVGRSLRRIDAAARENGYLADVPPFLHEADAGFLPRDKMVLVCTGSQGEPRAALARIAAGDHPNVALEEGDAVIFSSRVIPGNELPIARIQNLLIRLGIEVITSKQHFVHVSGHPGRAEMMRMYRHLRPRICIPVHGETRHLVEHAALAGECGVAETVIAENGRMVRLAPGTAGIVDEVPVGRLALEGNRVVPMGGELIRSRKRAVFNGTAVVTVVLDGAGELVAEPQMSTIGLLDGSDAGTAEAIAAAAGTTIERMARSARHNDERVGETVRAAVRKCFRDRFGKRPVIQVHLVRI
jgi:ribonuclease J